MGVDSFGGDGARVSVGGAVDCVEEGDEIMQCAEMTGAEFINSIDFSNTEKEEEW